VPLSELRLQDLRCIASAVLRLHPRMNLITGENGAGKTTLLEAIYLLGRGRSFRTRLMAQLIRRGCLEGWAAGRIEPLAPLSLPDGAISPVEICARRVDVVSRGEGVSARIDAHPVHSLAELSQILPVQVIDPGIHRLVEEGPTLRRRWLDWAVFHVEPAFVSQWQGYTRALRQRNAALRGGWDPAPWEPELARLGEAMTAARERVLVELQGDWQRTVTELGSVAATLEFACGWSHEETLARSLERHRPRDREQGVTARGAHRADVRLQIDGRGARDVVSRGQQKVLGAAMALAVVRYLASRVDTVPLLLLDDPAAELDAAHTRALLSAASALGGQTVVTALHPDRLPELVADRVFHVERGEVKPV
jgi:DNA replication and repair protein RecF